jgi:hypothetical protein
MNVLVRRHVIQNRLNEDPDLIESIREITEAERVLDEPPGEFKFEYVPIEYQGGVRRLFKAIYIMVEREMDKDKECWICILGARTVMDRPVVCVLKVLLLMGVTKDRDLSNACYTLFVNITTAENGTTEEMLNRVSKESYYTRELSKAILESVT